MARPILHPVASALVLSLYACGGGEAAEGELSGAVMVDGSSSVFPITEAVAEEFMIEYPHVRVSVGASGTGGGFGKFLRGETDINDASRPITTDERTTAEQAGIEFIELPVAYDGLAIVTNPANDFVDCLTTAELEAIWKPGSEVDNWRDIRPEFPDKPLALYGAGTDSGTYDYFTKAIGGAEGASRADYTASEDDHVLVQGIAGDRNALGFIPMAYYVESAEKIRLLGVDNGSGCVQPTVETVGTGTYQPLSRPEFIYVNAARADDAAVDAFVRFYLEYAPTLVEEVGYISLSPTAYEVALERFADRVTGSVFEGGSAPGVTMEELLRRGNARESETTDK